MASGKGASTGRAGMGRGRCGLKPLSRSCSSVPLDICPKLRQIVETPVLQELYPVASGLSTWGNPWQASNLQQVPHLYGRSSVFHRLRYHGLVATSYQRTSVQRVEMARREKLDPKLPAFRQKPVMPYIESES